MSKEEIRRSAAVDETKAMREKLKRAYKGETMTVDPMHNKYTPIWDVVIVSALFFTALETPFEVTFMDEGPCVTGLFIVNRIVDLIFLIDIVLQFVLHYQDRNGNWVRTSKRIVMNYLSGWFAIDVLSVVPFWVPTFVMKGDVVCGAGLGAQVAGATIDAVAGMEGGRLLEEVPRAILRQRSSSDGLQAMRMVRLIRLLRLARIAKASRVLKRFVVDLLVTRLEMTFAKMQVMQLLVLMVWISHIQACAWALVSMYMEDPDDADAPTTWVGVFRSNELAMGRTASPGSLYVASLYWSTMTLTSIGYGDIAPQNDLERVVCCLLMVISAATWAYVIGTAAGIAATLDPNTVKFRQTMDVLNYFMVDRKLDKERRHQLREFFSDARRVHQKHNDSDLLEKMSPMLQGFVALEASTGWFQNVTFLRNFAVEGSPEARSERDFIAALSMTLGMMALPLTTYYLPLTTYHSLLTSSPHSR